MIMAIGFRVGSPHCMRSAQAQTACVIAAVSRLLTVGQDDAFCFTTSRFNLPALEN